MVVISFRIGAFKIGWFINWNHFLASLPVVTQQDPTKQQLLWQILGPIEGDDPRVVDYARRDYLVAPSTLPYNLSTDPVYRADGKKGSWIHIHGYLQRLFREERNK